MFKSETQPLVKGTWLSIGCVPQEGQAVPRHSVSSDTDVQQAVGKPIICVPHYRNNSHIPRCLGSSNLIRKSKMLSNIHVHQLSQNRPYIFSVTLEKQSSSKQAVLIDLYSNKEITGIRAEENAFDRYHYR